MQNGSNPKPGECTLWGYVASYMELNTGCAAKDTWYYHLGTVGVIGCLPKNGRCSFLILNAKMSTTVTKFTNHIQM